ncbi:myosin light chain 5 [Panthera tigris]|uniref:myosin light chain 5 n=1 Tax=Panthera tigris TaxID=9694 RepID=UPI001C6FB145|nr:myosin light chain 5 [Panthera tigris]
MRLATSKGTAAPPGGRRWNGVRPLGAGKSPGALFATSCACATAEQGLESRGRSPPPPTPGGWSAACSPAQACPGPWPSQASRKTKKKEGGGLRAQRASSNVFSNFEQTQIQEFKEAFTLMDQNRDGFIDKEDLKDTYASLGKTNVKDDELDAMLKEASGPINFTMFLNMFGAKLTGTDAEETILNAFKMLDPEGKGSINKDYIKRLLMSQADKMTAEEVDQMFQFATIDAAGNLDYKALSYVLTHGEEKEE